MFSYSDNVDKELKYNQYISISSIDSHASHTKEECSSEKTGIQSLENLQWRYFGDNLDGAIAKCLLCKNNQTNCDARKSSREWWKHHESQSPLGLVAKLVKVVFPVPAASSKSEQRVFSVAGNVVIPKGAKLNPEKVKDLVVAKCNLKLLKAFQKLNMSPF